MQDLLAPMESVGLRKRDTALPTEDSCGRIRMSISYNPNREELKVFVNRAVGLPGSHLEDPPDPYVKLYLLPEKSKKSKRKTDVVKDTCSPTYDEEFVYSNVSHDKIGAMQLQVTVVDKKTREGGPTLLSKFNCYL
jgi:Ca2+-dependent lipid-binding protein